MANIIRYEPFNDLLSIRKQMDDLFDMFSTRSVGSGNGWSMPLVDMYQTEDDVIVKATMPGVEVEDLDIQVTGDTLTIRAEMEHEEEVTEAKYHLREQRHQTFARTISLPTMIKADKAEAVMKNGILTLTLPKAEEVKPKAITVKAK